MNKNNVKACQLYSKVMGYKDASMRSPSMTVLFSKDDKLDVSLLKTVQPNKGM